MGAPPSSSSSGCECSAGWAEEASFDASSSFGMIDDVGLLLLLVTESDREGLPLPGTTRMRAKSLPLLMPSMVDGVLLTLLLLPLPPSALAVALARLMEFFK